MELNIRNISGTETGKKITLPEEIFAIEPNDHAIWLDVKQFMANNRQGTHKAKTKHEIHRTTKKLKRQKGTGGARAGSMKSPLFRGGGRVFGPVPRDYSFKLNKKLKQLARKSALSYKAKDNGILVIEDFNMDNAKTKEYTNILKSLNLQDSKNLLLVGTYNKNVYLSGRNLPKNNIMVAGEVNTYAILDAQKLVVTESALKAITESFAN